jgi:hypothetical protein
MRRNTSLWHQVLKAAMHGLVARIALRKHVPLRARVWNFAESFYNSKDIVFMVFFAIAMNTTTHLSLRQV